MAWCSAKAQGQLYLFFTFYVEYELSLVKSTKILSTAVLESFRVAVAKYTL